jgi:hypothetical protein
MSWFDVDPKGLRAVLARRGPEFILYELIANGWDEPGVSKVEAQLSKTGHDAYSLLVQDNAPQGFHDLSHAYTLFAPSKKLTDVESRGRWNWGEKLVVANAESAMITTTKGQVIFHRDGRRYTTDLIQPIGTMVSLDFQLTEAQAKSLDRAARLLLPPEKVLTYWDKKALQRPPLVQTAHGPMPTEVADEHGNLRPTKRNTDIQLFFVPEGEQAWLYEMGIPVCELDMPWHVNVLQKIPLTMDRESVRPAFLKVLYVTIMNEAYARLITKEQATEPWARIAGAHAECNPDAIKHLTKLRFGEQVVAYDPSDPEANARAMAAGYTVVHGGALSGGEWKNIKAIGNIKPAGQVLGTPRPFALDDGTGKMKEVAWVPVEKRTTEQHRLVAYVYMLATQLLHKPVKVLLCDDRRWTTQDGRAVRACYGNGEVILNWRYISIEPEPLHRTILHELAHDFSENHLDDAYHDGLALLGARLAILVAAKPEPYQPWLWPIEEGT